MTIIDNDNTVSMIKMDFKHPDRNVAEESKAADRQASGTTVMDEVREAPKLSVHHSIMSKRSGGYSGFGVSSKSSVTPVKPMVGGDDDPMSGAFEENDKI